MRRLGTALPIAALALAACGAEKSASYYMAHRSEAQETAAACIASDKTGQNCANAGLALTRLGRLDFEKARAAEATAIGNGSDRPTLGGTH